MWTCLGWGKGLNPCLLLTLLVSVENGDPTPKSREDERIFRLW